MGVGCNLEQFVVYCVLFVMMLTNTEKNSAISEEGHVLTVYGFSLVTSLASMQIKSFWNPFPKKYSGLTLKIYIDPRAWPAGSALKIKKTRPKGKIVLIKKETTQKKKKKTVQRSKEQRLGESNPDYLHVQATLDHCTSVTQMIWKLILSYQNNFSLP